MFLRVGVITRVFVLGMMVGAIPTHAEVLDLKSSYYLALEHDPTIKIAEAEFKAGKENVKIARSALLPNVSGFGTKEWRETSTEGLFPITLDQDQNPITAEIRALRPVNNESDVQTETWGVTLSQSIFEPSKWFDFRQGKFESEKAEIQFAIDQQDLIVRVVQSYFDIMRAQGNLEATSLLEKADEEHIAWAEKRANTGISAKTEIFQAQAAFDLSHAARLTNEDELGEANEALSLIVGEYVDDIKFWSQHFKVQKPEPIGLDEWTEFSLKNNLTLKLARKQMKAAKSSARSAASRHLPTATFEYRHSESDSDTSEIDDGLPFDYLSSTDSKIITLNVSMPIFTGGGTSARRRQAYQQYYRELEAYKGAMKDVERSVRVTYRKLISDIRRYEVAKTAVESNQKALDAVERSYGVGVSDINDVINQRRNLYSAYRNFNNARYDYVINLVNLKVLAGTLSPEDIEQLNALL